MSLIQDTEQATECLDHLQTMLWEGGDHSQDDEVTSLICMLQSPLFRQLLVLQDSLQELEQVNQGKGLEDCDFELLPELHLEEGHVNPVFKHESPVLPKTSPTYKTTPGYDEELQRVVETAAQGRDVEAVQLFKPEKQSLGFSVVANQGESGIFIQDIQPGGIADRHGGLRERDQILAIDGQPLDISHQEAIKILQSAGGLVEIIVARGPLPQGPGDLSPGQETATQSVVETPEMLNTEWTQIEVIDLINDGTGLGFGIIGGRSTGVVVKTILPGGVADADGRLHSGDHILEIGEVNVRGMGSEQVAAVLRQSGSHVRLIVARPIIEPTSIPPPNAPIVPTHQLDQHLQEIHALLDKQEMMIENSIEQQQPPAPPGLIQQQGGMLEVAQVHPPPYNSEEMTSEYPEVEYFGVNLAKDIHQGLGITIAGYVGRENTPDDLCGIFVKSITEGSAASMNGQIQVNDQIIEVDGQPLQGYSNHDAVEVLRNTGTVVNLKLARYQHGAKFEKLQQYLAQPQLNGGPTLPPPTSTLGQPPVYNLAPQQNQIQQQAPVELEDVSLYPQSDDIDGELSPEVEVALRACWEPIIGDEFDVVVAQLSKFREGGGLGISLEGTVDVENGVEMRPHHYIRAILPDGPVGVNGRLLSGDELLEVNGKRLLGLNHKEVVGILKDLPQNVRLVCARRKHTAKENYAPEGEFSTPPLNTGVIENVPERLVKSKSDQALNTEPPAQSNLLNKKSRSLEPLTGLAMWSSEPVIIELRKGDKGLGFSILDYQDPVNPAETVIVIRSLVPGGVAQLDGRLVPGDRLIFVNDVNLENATLDEAVQALKGAPKGVVKIGVAKPLPFSGAPHQEPVVEPIEVGEPAVEDKQLASHQTPRLSPEKEKGARRSGVKPPVPPKPFKSPNTSNAGQEEPPPLPISSPPPITSQDVDVKSKPFGRELDHQKTDSVDSTSSSEHFTTSDLKAVPSPSPSASPRTESPLLMSPRTASPGRSPGRSPISSPSLMRSFSGPDAFPPHLERKIILKRSQNNLGVGVEATEKGVNGCVVKSLTKSGAIYKDGNIQVGDHIMSINNESMRRITNTQARVILRRASLMGSTDISISYVTAADAAAFKESLEGRPPQSPSTPTMMPSPKIFPKYYRSTLSPRTGRASVTSEGSASSTPSSPAKSVSPMTMSGVESPPPPAISPQSPPPQAPHTQAPPQASPRRINKAEEVSLANQTWGPPRLVELHREPGRTLGISIVGGRVDMFHVAEEHVISGIFIKHVLEESPAGRNGTLKTGDRILQVDGKDLRNATHDQAVEIIRHASNPVKFVVQSLGDPACPGDLETDTKSVHSYDEANLQLQPVAITTTQNEVVETPIQTSSPVPPLSAEPSEEKIEEEEAEYGYTMERIQRRYGELNGELLLVELKRGQTGLGISLAGNKDRNTMSVFVAGIQPDSSAALDGQIQVGDELLEVNGQVLYGRSHLNASAIIKGLNAIVVKFVVLRQEDNLERMAVKPLKMASPIHNKEQSERVESAQSHSPPYPEPATISPTLSEDKTSLPSQASIHDVIQVINLQKGPSGLGFAIVEEARDGRQGIYVRSITVGGVADKDGQLSVGDQILEVQDKNLTDVHYEKAIDILRNSQANVRLKVRKCQLEALPDSIPPGQGQITLTEVPGESSTDVADSTTNQMSEDSSHDPLTCPIVPGQETSILIEKGRTGLGLSIVGGADTLLGAIIIHEVYEDGAAARDRRLWAGDQVLEVNNENLREATHDYAIQVLRQTPATVQMLVFRDDSHVKEEDIYDVFTVELIKKPGKGLGLSIVGKRNDVGVYISDIVKGGASEADGRLMQGDQILAVNGEDMRNATQEYAAAVLKTLMGKVTLTVGRLKAGSRTSSRRNSSSPGHPLRKTESTASNKSRGGRHSKKGSEDMSHIRTVELQHDTSGSLGLSIAGGLGSNLGDTPVVVANMTPNGSAEKSRKLKVGDKILSINGVSTEGLQHVQVIQMLKSAEGSVTLQVTQGEQTQVSVSGRTSVTKSISSEHPPEIHTPTPQENNVFDPEEEGPPPQCKTIVLERGPDGLGFSIVGGHGSPHGDLPIYVKNVFLKGAAAENGQLKRGDQILSVNGQSLEGLNHEEAVNILKNAKGTVNMSVLS